MYIRGQLHKNLAKRTKNKDSSWAFHMDYGHNIEYY